MWAPVERALDVLALTLEEGSPELSVSLPADEVTMKEMGRNQQLRTGEVLIDRKSVV